MGQHLRIGKAAAVAGVSADTIRYYERLGLLPKALRSAAGYRLYPEGVVARLALVRHAQHFGFSLREIAGFLRIREAGGKPCRDVRAGAQRLLDAADQQIADLLVARERIQETLRTWDQRLSVTPADRPARLLETLGATSAGPATARKARAFRQRSHA